MDSHKKPKIEDFHHIDVYTYRHIIKQKSDIPRSSSGMESLAQKIGSWDSE